MEQAEAEEETAARSGQMLKEAPEDSLAAVVVVVVLGHLALEASAALDREVDRE